MVRKKRRVKRIQPRLVASTQLARLLSDNLSHSMALTRADAVKRLWERARRRNLCANKTIACDKPMRDVFKKDTLQFHEVAKALAPHLGTTTKEPGALTSRRAEASTSASAGPAAPSASAQPAAPTPAVTRTSTQPDMQRFAFLPAFAELLVGQPATPAAATMSVADALRRLGRYVRVHQLRSRTDPRKVDCNASLTALFGVTSFTVFTARALVLKCIVGASAATADGDEDCSLEAKRDELKRVRAALKQMSRTAETASRAYREAYLKYAELEAELATSAPASASESSTASNDPSSTSKVASAAELPDGRARPPEELFCPITLALMRDPVSTCDGQAYERDAITKWLLEHRTSPLTGLELASSALIPNLPLRRMCDDWQKCTAAAEDSTGLGAS